MFSSLDKWELVGARPLHLAAARPFCHLKAPLGLSLFCFAPQTRICLLFLIIEVNDKCSHHSNSKNNAPLWCIDPICKDGTTYIPNNYGYDHCSNRFPHTITLLVKFRVIILSLRWFLPAEKLPPGRFTLFSAAFYSSDPWQRHQGEPSARWPAPPR